MLTSGKRYAQVVRNHVSGFSSQPKTSELPVFADAVVIGGGSLGSSVLYHLQKKGLATILLERDQLTSGTTWHSAGMLWRLRPTDTDIELNAYSKEMCKTLENETGIESFTENGGLFVANNERRLDEYKRFAETGKYYGIESKVIEPNKISDIHPLLRTDDLVGALVSTSSTSPNTQISPFEIVLSHRWNH